MDSRRTDSVQIEYITLSLACGRAKHAERPYRESVAEFGLPIAGGDLCERLHLQLLWQDK